MTTADLALQGDLIDETDPRYDDARRIWNGAVVRRPLLIARCVGPQDVQAALRWARAHDVPVAVRGGGHGVAGHAVADGALVIDCAPMAQITVDPQRRRVRVGSGALLGDLARATEPYGLAVPAGIVSHTGVAGLTLGGGIGWLTRRFGLTCDSLIRAELVTADGTLVTASAVDDPELLWGLRGGGGNFGVVTSFEFDCHPVGDRVLAGPIMWPAEDAAELLAFYRELAATAPDELTTISFVRHAPPAPWVPEDLRLRPVVMVAVCYAGDLVAGERVLQPLRSWGRPMLDLVEARSLADYTYFFDAAVPHGFGYYWKSSYLTGLTDAAISTYVDRGWQARSHRSYTITFHLGGAMAAVDPQDAAFEDRTAVFAANVNAVSQDPQHIPDVDWARSFAAELAPAATGGTYLNFMDADDQGRVADTYGQEKLGRLLALKDRVDPDNVFRLNHNLHSVRQRTG